MGKFLYSDFKGYNNEDYTIEIYDVISGKSANNEFTISGLKGLEFRTEGGAKNFYKQRIKPQSVSFDMFVYENDPTESFIDDLPNASDRQYYVHIYREGVTWFIGWLLPDNITILDEGYDSNHPFTATLTCIDGLSMLHNIKYAISDSIVYKGTDTILTHIFNCFDKIGLGTYYGSDNFLQINCDWYDTAHPNTTDNPFDNTKIKHANYYGNANNRSKIISDSGGYYVQSDKEVLSCYEVLYKICKRFNMQLYYSSGRYWMEQYSQRDSTSVRYFIYDESANLLNTVTYSGGALDKVEADGLIEKMGGGTSNFLPPLERVVEKYQTGIKGNLIAGLVWNDSEALEYTLLDVEDDDNAFLDCVFNFERISSTTDPTWTNHRYHWRIKIKVGNYWLKRTADGISDEWPGSYVVDYSGVTWESSESYYEVVSEVMYAANTTPINPGSPAQFDGSTTFQTPTLEETGSLLVEVTLWKMVDEELALLGLPPSYTTSWESANNSLFVVNDNGSTGENTFLVYQSIGDSNNVLREDYEINIGDLITNRFTFADLQVNNGSEYVKSSSWAISSNGGGSPISQLTVDEMMSLRNKPIKLMRASFFIQNSLYQFGAEHRISYDGSYFMLLFGQFNTGTGYFTGEWFEIAKDTSGLTSNSGEIEDVFPAKDGGYFPDYPVEPDPSEGSPSDTIDPGPNLDSIAILTTLSEAAYVNGPVVQFDINNTAGNTMMEGDIVQILHPVTGVSQEFTLTSDVGPSDTTMDVSSETLNQDFPAGSPVTLTATSANQKPLYQKFTGLTGTDVVITVGTLPDDGLSEAALNRKIQFYYNGQLLDITSASPPDLWTVQIDNDKGGTANNKFVMSENLEATDKIKVYFYP